MKVITIGRSSDNNVVVNDEKVSRHHLQIVEDDNGNHFVVDLQSTNGTFVNGQRITGEMPLQPHDVIMVGQTTLPWTQYFTASVIPAPVHQASRPAPVSPTPGGKKNRIWIYIVAGIALFLLVGGGISLIYVHKYNETKKQEQLIQQKKAEEAQLQKEWEELDRKSEKLDTEAAKAEAEAARAAEKAAKTKSTRDLAYAKQKEEEAKNARNKATKAQQEADQKKEELKKLQEKLSKLEADLAIEKKRADNEKSRADKAENELKKEQDASAKKDSQIIELRNQLEKANSKNKDKNNPKEDKKKATTPSVEEPTLEPQPASTTDTTK